MISLGTKVNDSNQGYVKYYRARTCDSSIPELSPIVVLCATEPNSKKFKKKWKSWLADNYRPGMDVDAIIADVVRQADRHRRKTWKKARSSKGAKKVSKMMHDMAMSVIRNIR